MSHNPISSNWIKWVPSFFGGRTFLQRLSGATFFVGRLDDFPFINHWGTWCHAFSCRSGTWQNTLRTPVNSRCCIYFGNPRFSQRIWDTCAVFLYWANETLSYGERALKHARHLLNTLMSMKACAIPLLIIADSDMVKGFSCYWILFAC